MSQISMNNNLQVEYYQLNNFEQTIKRDSIPEEFKNARPAPHSSTAKIVDRIDLGIATSGLSEVVRFAYRGIKSLVAETSPSTNRGPRIGQNQGVVSAFAPNIK